MMTTTVICQRCGKQASLAKTGKDPRFPDMLDLVDASGLAHEKSCEGMKAKRRPRPISAPPQAAPRTEPAKKRR